MLNEPVCVSHLLSFCFKDRDSILFCGVLKLWNKNTVAIQTIELVLGVWKPNPNPNPNPKTRYKLKQLLSKSRKQILRIS